MSDPRKRLRDAFVQEREPGQDTRESESQERTDSVAFFEQTVVPGFEAAAQEINEEPTRQAEVERSPSERDALYVQITVKHNGHTEFVGLLQAMMRPLPITWEFKITPTVKGDGTLTSSTTTSEMEWEPPKMTADKIVNFLLTKYAQVVESQNRNRRPGR